MPSVTRHPTREELTCLICGAPDVAFDHIQERSTHPQLKKEPTNIAPLCPGHHLAKTNKVMETEVYEDPDGGLYYQWRRRNEDAPWIIIPVKVNKRHKCLEPDRAAEEAVVGEEPAVKASPSSSAPSGSGSPAVEQQQNSANPQVSTDGSSAAEPPESLTHEKRIEICAQIRWMQQNRQWHTGDTANEWEEELGVEDFNNRYANEFGYSYPSLRNCMRVAKRIPENERHYEVSFGHEAAVYAWMNLEDRDAWLPRAHDEGWNVARFKDALREEGLLPPRKTTKRWTIEEIREEITQFLNWTTGQNPCAPTTVMYFLDWLEEQE